MSGLNGDLSDDLLPEERRQRLVEWFTANAAASSQDLARMFNTSVSTIRRDLDILASDGIVRRTHGGAVSIRRLATYEPSTDLARRTATEEKAAIAREALRIIQPQQSLLIDTGATCHLLAEALATVVFPLTIVTNDLYVAQTLTYRDNISLVVPGGTNREGAYSLLGEPGLSFVRDLHCDQFFLSAQAVDDDWASDTQIDLVQMKRAMIAAAEQTTLLADSSRFSARAIYKIASTESLGRIITDTGLPDADRERFHLRGCDLICAEI